MEEFEFFKKSHNDLIEYAKDLRFDKKHQFHLTIIKLHGSIIELCGSIIILLEHEGKIGIPSIFRTLMETFVEFKNLSNDRNYDYYMEASHLKHWLKVLNESKEGKNPFLYPIGKMPNLNEQIKDYEKKLEDLKNNGYAPLTIKERFEKADMEDVYKSLYNLLSTDVHSGIQALINRHIDIDFKKSDFEVVFYKGEPIEEYLSYIDGATIVLIESGLTTHEILDSPKQTQIKEFETKFNELRQKYT